MSFVNYRHDLTVFRLSTNYGKSIVSDYKNGVALRALVCQYGKLHQLKKIDIREMLTCAGFEIRNPQCYLLKSRCQWYLFNGRYFQGTWELRYAIWLTANNVTFKSQKEIDPLLYELNGKQHLYYPDFYLPSLNRYIEIKGRYKARDKIKMDVIKHVYAKHEFLIITQADLKAQGIWNFYKQQNINFTDYVISADNKQRQIDLFLKNNDKQHVLASFNEEFQSISGHKSTRIKFALRRLREKYNVSVDVIKRVFEIWSIAKEGSGSFISRMPFCTRLN
jgi:predicted nucleic-acid-binding protein